jgi:RNA polymerase sigma-70 factor (ECF subfamily)
MSGSPLDLSIIEEQAGAVRDALISLPEEQRAVITTAYFGGFSQTEIAEKFNIPLGTVKTRMRLGMKRLQEVLAQRLHG